MKVTEVTVVAKYSLDTGHGWKSIEVGATGTLTASTETLESVQEELYKRLTKQLKTLWNNGNGRAEAQEQPKTETSAPKPSHWCEAHQTEYKRFEKDNKVWYSHKAPDGKWCKESGKK